MHPRAGAATPRFRWIGTDAFDHRHTSAPTLENVREIDLAVYADALAGEFAALSARAERLRSRLRQAKIDRRARNDLAPAAVDRLQALGLLGAIDERAVHAELRELEDSLAAVEELQAWVEGELAATNAA
jgi:hypothetical protein